MSADERAWHEAGHALSAHLLGGAVLEVTLASEEDALEAHVAVRWPPAADPTDDARRQALVALSGPVAELVFRGQDVLDDTAALWTWRADWDEAQRCIARLEPVEERREPLLHALLRELHDTFDDPHTYERLARIADALDAHETLDEALFLDAAAS